MKIVRIPSGWGSSRQTSAEDKEFAAKERMIRLELAYLARLSVGSQGTGCGHMSIHHGPLPGIAAEFQVAGGPARGLGGLGARRSCEADHGGGG